MSKEREGKTPRGSQTHYELIQAQMKLATSRSSFSQPHKPKPEEETKKPQIMNQYTGNQNRSQSLKHDQIDQNSNGYVVTHEQMWKMEENFLCANITISQYHWNSMRQLTYYYELKDKRSYQTYLINRDIKSTFKDCTHYFDTPIEFMTREMGGNAYFNQQIYKALSQYFNLFIKNSKFETEPDIFVKFRQFCACINTQLADSDLYDNIDQYFKELLTREFDIDKFIIQVFEILYYNIHDEMHYFTINRLHELIKTLTANIDPDRFLKAYLKAKDNRNVLYGIQRLIRYEPIIGLIFMFCPEIIQKPDSHIQSIRKYLERHQIPPNFVKYIDLIKEKEPLNPVIPELTLILLQCCTNFETFYQNVKHLWGQVHVSIFEEGYLGLKARLKEEVSSGIIKNLTDILQSEHGQIFIKDAEDLIVDSLNQKRSKVAGIDIIDALVNSKYLSYSTLIALAHNLTDHSLKAFCSLLATAVKQYKVYLHYEEVKEIYQQLVRYSVKDETSLPIIYTKLLQINETIQDMNVFSNERVRFQDRDFEKMIRTVAQYKLSRLKDSQVIADIIPYFCQERNSCIDSAFSDRIMEAISKLENILDFQNLILGIQADQNLQNREEIKGIISLLLFHIESKIPDVQLEQIFTNPLFASILLLNRNYPGAFDLVKAITTKVKKFIQSIKQKSITIVDLQSYFTDDNEEAMNNKKDKSSNKLQKIKTILNEVDPTFQFDQTRAQLIGIEKDYSNRIMKYENFLNFAMRLEDNIDILEYQRKLNQLKTDRVTQPLQKILNPSYYSWFDSFKSIDMLYFFTTSKVFNNIFNETIKNLGLNKEEEKKGEEEKVAIDVEELKEENIAADQIGAPSQSLKRFDFKIHDIFIQRQVGFQHFKDLIQYDKTKLTNGILKKYWRGVDLRSVNEEIQVIQNYASAQLKIPISGIKITELKNDLRNYCNIPTILKGCQIILRMEYLLELVGLKDSREYKDLEKFQNVISNLNDNKKLDEISKTASSANDVLQNLESFDIKIVDDFEKLSECGGLFKFCIESEGQNFNDLYEKLDSHDLISNQTITDMNTIQTFFLNLRNKINTNKEQLNFRGALCMISEYHTQSIANDSTFKFKLQNVLNNLDIIKSINNAATNLAQNTLRIIEQMFQQGLIIIKFNKSKYELEFQYDTQQPSLKDEQIRQNASRAIFLGSNKDQKVLHKINDSNQIDLFIEIVQISQALCELKTKLYLSGHFEYQNKQELNIPVLGNVLQLNFNVGSYNIKEVLVNHKTMFEADLQSWKQILKEKRKQHFYLTFIPNQQLSNLAQFIEGENSVKDEVYTIFRFINSKFNEVNIEKIRNIALDSASNTNKLDEIGSWLSQVFQELPEESQKISLFNMGKDKSPQTFKPLIKEGQINYYKVNDETELIQSILSIYTIMEYVPLASEILFCSNETKIHQVESFILRALFLPQGKFKREKMFVLADFSRLSVRVQIDTYKLIREIEEFNKAHGYKNYRLTVLFQYNNQYKDNLIEELKGKELLTSLIKTQIMQQFIGAFFIHFKNVNVVTSEINGNGKSDYAREQIQNELKLKYFRVPVFGDLNREKFIQHHQNQKITEKCGIHYDIYPTYNDSLNVVMFEALILNCIQYNSKIYHFPKNSHYFLELSSELDRSFVNKQYFLSNFQSKRLTWEQVWNSRNYRVDMNTNSNIQIVCKYINLTLKDALKTHKMEAKLQPMKPEECIQILDEYLFKKIERPNFYVLNSYLAFAGDNLRRLEQSTFFNNDFIIKEQFSNEGKVLVEAIITQTIYQSKLLSQVDISFKNQEAAEQNMSDSDLQAKLLDQLKWDRTNALFIMINDNGGITPIYKDPMELPPAFINSVKTISDKILQTSTNYKVSSEKETDQGKKEKLKQQAEEQMTNYVEYLNEIKPFTELKQEFLIKKILRMCTNLNDKDKITDINRIVFTRDNFLKMALIYQRLRSSQPVLIMGETGVGKTAVISYLANLIKYDFKVLNIHAGITESEIIKFVKDAELEAALYPQRNMILFFDEINTNNNVNGLLKEIMIDRHLLGLKIADNIRLAAACNPYKVKSEEAIKNSISAGIKHSKSDQKTSKLVYTVNPLPTSMLSYIWDYGSLNQDEEITYINKIIDTIRDESQILKNVTDKQINLIATKVNYAQHFIRQHDAQWAVSLRDVARFKKLFIYFSENTYGQNHSIERSFVLSISFCYLFRISKRELRLDFVKGLLENTKNLLQLTMNQYRDILQQEYSLYLNNIEIPLGIGRNSPLKENIFVIITCILNNIPLFITGKPGSSKTLALNLVTKSMRGQGSTNEFFKKLPSVITFAYQGSVQSTSRGVENVFERAINFKNSMKEESKSIVLIIFDEIGLAEISPHNPLKVLHSLLEPPKVAFVGISNWSLDASKMNRAITLSRPDARKQDLYESALAISEEVNKQQLRDGINLMGFKSTFARPLVDSYYQYHSQQEIDNFHGLRDFYSLVSQLCINYVHYGNPKNFATLKSAILRNFGGQEIDKVIKVFKDNFQGQLNDFKKVPTTDLIKQNLQDPNSRHLMIITENQEGSAIQFVENHFNQQKTEYRIFYGSDFVEDLQEEAAYKQINDIILSMERGITVVLLNLDNIYQSFYDMLNQNYQIIGGQKFCKVAIGPDSSKVPVHPNFKCILITTQSQVNQMDAPLLNRFEKQLYKQLDQLSLKEQQILDQLLDWTDNYANIPNEQPVFTTQSAFPTVSDMKNTIIQLMKGHGKEIREEDLLEIYKSYMIQISNMQGVIRSTKSKNSDSEHKYKQYLSENHYNLNEFLSIFKETWQNDLFYDENNKGFNIVIHTYSSISEEIFGEKNSEIILNQIFSQRELDHFIENFFSNNSESQILYIYADSTKDSAMRISMCKNIINNHRAQYRNSGIMDKHVCLVLKIGDKYTGGNNFGCGWRDYFIDKLNGRGTTDVEIKALAKLSFNEVLTNKEIFRYLLRISLSNIIGNIRYGNREQKNEDDNKSHLFLKRMRKIEKLLDEADNENNDNFISEINRYFMMFIENHDQIEDWQLNVCMDEFLMKTHKSFHSAAIEYLQRFIIKYCSYIIFTMENYGVINAYYKPNKQNISRKQSQEYINLRYSTQDIYRTLFEDVLIKNEKFLDKYLLENAYNYSGFPLLTLINSCFEPLKAVFQEEIQQIELTKVLVEQNQDKQSEIKQSIDAQITQSVTKFKDKCERIFPRYLQRQNLLASQTDDFLFAFPDTIGNGINEKSYHQMVSKMIQISKIINNGEVQQERYQKLDVFEVYTIYWMNEQVIESLWKLFSNNKDLIDILALLDDIQIILQKDNQNVMLTFYTSYYLKEAILHAIYHQVLSRLQLLRGMPEENPNDDNLKYQELLKWSKLVDKLLTDLKEFELYQCTKELKTLEFMRRFIQQLIIPMKFKPGIIFTIISEIQSILDPISLFKIIYKQVKDQERNGVFVDNNALSTYVYGFFEEQFPSLKQEQVSPVINCCLELIAFNYINSKNDDFIINLSQSLIKKICTMIYEFKQGSLEKILILSYEEAIQENPLIESLQYFVDAYIKRQSNPNKGEQAQLKQLNMNNPILILFADSFQHYFDEQEYDYQEQTVKNYIERSFEYAFSNEHHFYLRVIAIAFLRSQIMKSMNILALYLQEQNNPEIEVDNQEEEKKEHEEDEEQTERKLIHDRFQRISDIFVIMDGYFNEAKKHPDLYQMVKEIFQIYILRLLSQTLSIKDIALKASKHLRFIEDLDFAQGKKFFSYIKSVEKFSEVFSYIGKRENVRKTLQDTYNKPDQKSILYLAFLQYYYLNQNPDNGNVINEILTFNHEAFNKNFYQATLIGKFNNMQVCLEDREHYLGELLTYATTLSLTQNPGSFFALLLKDVKVLENSFIPFIANVKEEARYEVVFQQEKFEPGIRIYKGFRRYRCKKCKFIVIVVDCGQLSNEHKDGGSGACEGCGEKIGYENRDNMEPIDPGRVQKKNFCTDDDAIKGYIILDPEMNDILELRKMNDNARNIGYIILHTLMLSSLLFSSNQMILAKYITPLGRHYPRFEEIPKDKVLSDGCTFLQMQIDFCWNKLKGTLGLNDQKLLTIFEHIMQKIFEKSDQQELQAEKLQTKEGRKEFEKYFQEHCIKGLDNNFQDIFNNALPIQSKQQEQSETLMLINDELYKPKQQLHPESLLIQPYFRLQTPINTRQFFNYLQKVESTESKVIREVIEQVKSLNWTQYIKPLVDWANYIKKKFNGKISKEEALNDSIEDIISKQKLSQEEKNVAWKIYETFEKAWNSFAGNFVREGCDKINISAVSKNSRFQQFCITRTSRDSLGYTFYLLLRSFYQSQNVFLALVSQCSQPEVEFPECSVMKLRNDQVITTPIDENYIQKLVYENSYNDFEFGKGRTIHYNTEKIYKELCEVLINNKVMIEDDNDMDFQYQNIGQLYFVYEEIKGRVPQAKCDAFSFSVVKDLSNESKNSIFNDLSIALNFLQQTGGNPETLILEYMNAFNIQARDFQGIRGSTSDFRLKHILYIYEQVELAFLDVLINKTHEKYKIELTEEQKEGLLQKFSQDNERNHEFQMQQVKFEVIEEEKVQNIQNEENEIRFLSQIKSYVGRLAIRQFVNQDITEIASLFVYLFNEMNEYLFGIDEKVDYEELGKKFESISIRNGNQGLIQQAIDVPQIQTGNIYHTYMTLKHRIDQLEREKQFRLEQEEILKRENLKKIKSQQNNEEGNLRMNIAGGQMNQMQQNNQYDGGYDDFFNI